MTWPLAMHDMTLGESRDARTAVSVMGEEEFRAFYERTARPLWAYLSRITGDRQKADDYLQEAYYRFYRAGRQYESESHRRNSLFQIATNLVRDAARRSRRYEEVPLQTDDSAAGPTLHSPAPNPERQVAMRNDVTRALKQLDPAQRELLWLAYAQGVSHQEISEILGVRAISVRTLLLRARRKLAAILERGQ
ncbi:MAG TPA: RNA polymerase sigma factor [Thermoanaerobaculia bacterium]|nr:RNA polymerase sigma factor [Thermoanaerobaculia bacterium]